MKKVLFVCSLLSCLCLANAHEMKISSSNFKNKSNFGQGQIANSFGCSGKNLSPELSWSGVPKNAKSLAITVYDPDAPTGSGFWHWIAYDINADTKSITEGASSTAAMPKGAVETLNDAGSKGYLGACPPKGNKPHRYQVTLYALDVDKLPVPANATSVIARFILNKHSIGKTTITAYAKTE